ncbi:MAG: hypothetical protein JJU45_01710 [Acidimicrobiia bacterium]|nr:hypothetical protein [Acidimicrobiia bacterium]
MTSVCDTFCVVHPDAMLVAKNSDRPVAEPQVVEAHLPRTSNGADGGLATQYLTIPDLGAPHPVLGSRPLWLWGFEHGLTAGDGTAGGLVVGNEKVWTIDDPHGAPPALLGMDLVRLALERASSADEALEAVTSLLAEYGQGGSGEEHADEPYHSSFLLADAHGGWHLETAGRSWVAAPVGGGTAISNRLSISTEWTRSSPDVTPGSDWQAWRDQAAPTGIADHRLAATRACVARGSATGPAEAVATLRDHGSGPWGAPGTPAAMGDAPPPPPPADVGDDWSGITVCMHVRDYQATTAAMVAWLPHSPAAPRRMWAALGSPCASVFLPGVVLGHGPAAHVVLPAALSSPEMWHRLAGVARRVEAPGDQGLEALMAARRTLGPVEAAAWAEADELAATEGPGVVDAWGEAARRWSEATAAAVTEVTRTLGL